MRQPAVVDLPVKKGFLTMSCPQLLCTACNVLKSAGTDALKIFFGVAGTDTSEFVFGVA